MTTASITLTDTYIHLLDDPAELVEVQAVDLGESSSGPEEIRLYAAGNARRSIGKGALFKMNVTLDTVPPDVKKKLRSWIGAPLVIRDPRGRRWEGGIEGKSLDIQEDTATDTSTISFVFGATKTNYILVGE